LICEIQVKNGLDLGENYWNINGCKTFAASIAQTLVNFSYLILVLNKLSRRFLWLSSNFNNDWPIRVSAKACEWPAVAWGSNSLNQCLTHNKCSWECSGYVLQVL
jgi:hypothetical protein